MVDTYTIHPVGLIRKKDDTAWIEIFEEYREAMLGLEGFSHIHVLFWFHENDTPESVAAPCRCTRAKTRPTR